MNILRTSYIAGLDERVFATRRDVALLKSEIHEEQYGLLNNLRWAFESHPMDLVVMSRYIVLAGILKYVFRTRKLKMWQTLTGVALVVGLTGYDAWEYKDWMNGEESMLRNLAAHASRLSDFDGSDEFERTEEGVAARELADKDRDTRYKYLQKLFAWRTRTNYDSGYDR